MKVSYYLSRSYDNVLDDIDHVCVCVYVCIKLCRLAGCDSVPVVGIGSFAPLTMSRIACSSPYLLSSGYLGSFLRGEVD